MARPRGACRDLVGEHRRRLLAELASAYASGATIPALAAEHSRGEHSIKALLREAGVPLRERSPTIRGQARRTLAAQLRRRYEADRTLTVAALAETVPYSYPAVRSMLTEAGTTIRGHHHRYRRRTPPTPSPHLTGQARVRLLAELTRAYQSGASLTALATQHARTINNIRALLREAGTPLRQHATPTITGEARRELGHQLRQRYEADPSLSVAALAETVPYCYNAVRKMLTDAETTIRRHPSRTQQHDTASHHLGLALRHLYLTGTAEPDALAHLAEHTVGTVRDALRAVERTNPLTRPRTPGCPIPDDEALALGALLWPRHRNGTSIAELTPLGADAVPVIAHALHTYATAHPDARRLQH